MHPKDADGMANSVDPDQTASSEAVWFWSALFAETYLSQYIEFVWYVQVRKKFAQISYNYELTLYIMAIITPANLLHHFNAQNGFVVQNMSPL